MSLSLWFLNGNFGLPLKVSTGVYSKRQQPVHSVVKTMTQSNSDYNNANCVGIFTFEVNWSVKVPKQDFICVHQEYLSHGGMGAKE